MSQVSQVWYLIVSNSDLCLLTYHYATLYYIPCIKSPPHTSICCSYRGSSMSANVLLTLSNELGKRDKREACPIVQEDES